MLNNLSDLYIMLLNVYICLGWLAAVGAEGSTQEVPVWWVWSMLQQQRSAQGSHHAYPAHIWHISQGLTQVSCITYEYIPCGAPRDTQVAPRDTLVAPCPRDTHVVSRDMHVYPGVAHMWLHVAHMWIHVAHMWIHVWHTCGSTCDTHVALRDTIVRGSTWHTCGSTGHMCNVHGSTWHTCGSTWHTCGSMWHMWLHVTHMCKLWMAPCETRWKNVPRQFYNRYRLTASP